MIEDALAWAISLLGSPVSEARPLAGGMTSTMLALRHDCGIESVLRLMTEEPWRTHGPELTTRERNAQLMLAATAVPAPRSLVAHWSATSETVPESYWLVMDAVGFLPPPGRPPMFGEPAQLARLGAWLDRLVSYPLS